MTIKNSASPTSIVDKPDQAKQRRRTTLDWSRWVWSGLGLTIAVMTSATLGAIAAWVLPSPKSFVQTDVSWDRSFGYQLSQPIHILILGVDGIEGSDDRFSGHSDTILLLRFDPEDDSISLLSIPRDTPTNIPGVGLAKVNLANYEGGSNLAKETIAQLLNGIPIDRYVRINTEALREVVDAVGGIEVFVPSAMSYTDRAQQLEIDLEPGWQILHGTEAEQFSRFRQGAYGDVGRVQRQQALIQALRSRLTHPTVLPQLPKAIRIVQKYLDTDLSVPEMMALVNFGLHIDPDRLKMVMLPGQFGNLDTDGDWTIDAAGRDRILAEYFQQPIETEKTERSRYRLNPERVLASLRIAIQNPTPNTDAGNQLQTYLESKGSQGVYLSQNWLDRPRQTQIIVQKGDLKGAQFLQELLGFGNIVTDSTGDVGSDLTIRLGEDFNPATLKMENLSTSNP
jgi:polyisoprenyl-teichoic acid--peptidoglycan teichoic acid transferase